MKVSDEELLTLCLSGMTQRQIATKLGMSQPQVCRRMNKPEFQSLLGDHRKQCVDSVMTQLVDASQEAVKVLVELMQDRNPFARFSAASRILALTQDYTVQKDLISEVERIKEEQRILSERGGVL